MKKAYVFPGQGSQFPGMAREIYRNSISAKKMFDRANSILGYNITEIMFEGTNEDLKATKITQPAVFLHSYILAKCYNKFYPDMVAGHSLGEFTALTASEAIEFDDALQLVYIRAMEMQACCEKVPGTMAAIIALSEEKVEQICSEIEGVVPANYNCNGQIVISGERVAVKKACEIAKEAGAKRALLLPVGGAFHSPLMEPARIKLGNAISKTAIKKPICPIYQNVTALPTMEPEFIKENLLLQLTSPVKWTQTINNMVKEGAEYFMEIGPGTVLQGLIKKTAPQGIIIEGLHTI